MRAVLGAVFGFAISALGLSADYSEVGVFFDLVPNRAENVFSLFKRKHSGFNTKFTIGSGVSLVGQANKKRGVFTESIRFIRHEGVTSPEVPIKVGDFRRKHNWGANYAIINNAFSDESFELAAEGHEVISSYWFQKQPYIMSGIFSGVPELVLPKQADTLRVLPEITIQVPDQSYPRSLIGQHQFVSSVGRFGSFDGGIVGLVGLDQSLSNIENTSASRDNTKTSYYQHSQSKKRHFRLSYKVVLAALVFVCGFYYFTYALRHADRLREGQALLYIALGMAGVGSGIGSILAYGFTVISP